MQKLRIGTATYVPLVTARPADPVKPEEVDSFQKLVEGVQDEISARIVQAMWDLPEDETFDYLAFAKMHKEAFEDAAEDFVDAVGRQGTPALVRLVKDDGTLEAARKFGFSPTSLGDVMHNLDRIVLAVLNEQNFALALARDLGLQRPVEAETPR